MKRLKKIRGREFPSLFENHFYGWHRYICVHAACSLQSCLQELATSMGSHLHACTRGFLEPCLSSVSPARGPGGRWIPGAPADGWDSVQSDLRDPGGQARSAHPVDQGRSRCGRGLPFHGESHAHTSARTHRCEITDTHVQDMQYETHSPPQSETKLKLKSSRVPTFIYKHYPSLLHLVCLLMYLLL